MAREPSTTTVRLDAARSPAAARLASLVDNGPVEITGADDTVLTARAWLADVPTTVVVTDGTIRAGALGRASCALLADAVERAVDDGTPIVTLWHSAGARIDEGIGALDGIGRLFAAVTRASGRVPQISLVLGTAAGGAAYGASLGDLIVAGPDARMFVTGPGVVAEVTGESVTPSVLGGVDVHARRSGVVHVATPSERSAIDAVRDLVSLLGGLPDAVATPAADARFEHVLPQNPRTAYDVRPMVSMLLDPAEPVVELHGAWAPNIVTTLGRLDGRTVGVIASNPAWLAGCLDAQASDKAARFVQMCDAFGVPLVVVVDVPGYLPGVQQEWDGVLRRGAKLLHAFAAASVPRVTLYTRKAYGGAYIAMNSRALGASAALAWPTAEIAVMGVEAAVNVRHRRLIEAASPQERAALLERLVAQEPRDGLQQAIAAGYVDAVIQPADTKVALARALAMAQPGRGVRSNSPL